MNGLSTNAEFVLKEFECLREEVLWLLEDYRGLERNVLIAVATVGEA